MKVRIVAAGSLKDRGSRGMMDDYLERIAHYAPCREEELAAKPAAAAWDKAMRADVTVALEVGGERMSSHAFAQRIARWGAMGKGDVAFLIGGADGLPAEVSAAANAKLSLSDMILPHRLARVVLAEQIYRAFTILRGEPYSH